MALPVDETDMVTKVGSVDRNIVKATFDRQITGKMPPAIEIAQRYGNEGRHVQVDSVDDK
jgi:hypothetical protein